MTATRMTVRGDVVPDTSWSKDANCRGHDPNLWFPTGGSTWEERKAMRLAVETCRSCPVQAECRDYGLRYEREGIWGGLTPREREATRRAMGIPLVRVPARAHL